MTDVLNIGKDFSPDPSGRYRSDGDGSGEAFREDFLKDRVLSLEPGKKLVVILDDGVEGYGSSFLTEGFAGMIKYGYIEGQDLLNKLVIQFTDPDFEFYKNKIIEYIGKAKYNSKVYKLINSK